MSASLDWLLNDQLLSERQFKAVYRMTRNSFQIFLDQIWQHPIFYNNSNHPQLRPPKYQLQVALYHFGGGACGSHIRTAIQFGLAEGTVEVYVHRLIAFDKPVHSILDTLPLNIALCKALRVKPIENARIFLSIGNIFSPY